MCWMKKSFAAALCLVMCLVAFPVPQAMAAAPDATVESEIMPRMQYIYDADLDFSVSNGTAYLYAVVNGHSAVATKCEVTIELQKKGLLFWDTVETWTSTENGRRAEVDVSCGVTAGGTYRAVATVTVWSGSDSETQTMTSDTLRT